MPALGVVAALALSACAPAPKGGGINDPYEKQNRAVHRFNVGLDRHLVKPTSNVYGHVVPEPIRQGVANFASNLSQPSYILNDLLQGDVGDGAHTLFRFVVNTTAGVGGIFDPATALGINDQPNDFGHTLSVWGARQGAYLEVPVLGPSTERDLTGTVVDLAINPMNFLLNGDERKGGFVVQVFKKLGNRYKYSSTVDSILYGSGDSYAQERLIYLQSRDYQLGIKSKDDAFTDPYEDPYGN
ncbi:MlaA family lipoprotein [Acidimangrovimonas sediminis]|uniref:MlaA family lipoprotein n=1 Tax=Acidimangrovimonas sediminis TaxID=2056283 RepID=UPI001E36C540|nr:VacJ family lipoprotein [Acidimangrovimonas sediminis]